MAQLNARINKQSDQQSQQQLTPKTEKKSFTQNQSQPIYDSRNNVQPSRPEQTNQRSNNHQQQDAQHQHQQQMLQQYQMQQQQLLQQQQAQQQYYQQQQQQQQPQHTNEAIYTRAADRNHHYQQQQQQQQQQQHYIQTIDGKNQIYASSQPNHRHIHQKIYVSTNPFITTTQTAHYSPTSFGKESGQYSASSSKLISVDILSGVS